MVAPYIEPPHPHKTIQLLDQALVILRDLCANAPEDMHLKSAQEKVVQARLEVEHYVANTSPTQ
jgi:hypothetical protein